MTAADWLADVGHASAVALGGGGTVAIIAFVLRTWFDKRVTAHYQREVETHRAALAVDLEGIRRTAAEAIEATRQGAARDLEVLRQAAATSIEESRQDAARDLEAFKADLTFAAEVRRQVAAKRVAALLEIAAAGEPLERTVLAVGTTATLDYVDRMNAFYGTLRAHEYLLPAALAKAFAGYAADLGLEGHRFKQLDAGAMGRVQALTRGFLETLRHELGIELRKEAA